MPDICPSCRHPVRADTGVCDCLAKGPPVGRAPRVKVLESATLGCDFVNRNGKSCRAPVFPIQNQDGKFYCHWHDAFHDKYNPATKEDLKHLIFKMRHLGGFWEQDLEPIWAALSGEIIQEKERTA